MKFLNFLNFFWIFFILTKCSNNIELSETEKSLNYSSDDESTIDNGNEFITELDGAIENLRINEKSSRFQRENQLKQQQPAENGARPLSCIDGNGREVDWWFLYKREGDTQYLYYSSLDVQDDRNGFLPLNRDFTIDDKNTSPVLKTIYHPDNLAESSEVWLGWNDQPDNDDDDKESKKSKQQTDAYGGPVNGVKHAHSKGFYAQNAVVDPSNHKYVTIGSYVMMTSLPRFPRIFSNGNDLYGDALKNKLPSKPAKIFDSNLISKAQHFFCMSLPRETVELEKNQKTYEVPIDFSASHVKFLHKYLKTIHPAIMGTNFSDHKAEHRLWRRYFSLFQHPSKQAFLLLQSDNANERVMAFSKSNLPSYDKDSDPPTEASQHVFPLTWSTYFVSRAGNITKNSYSKFYRWGADFSNQNGCKDGSENSCLASFSTQTTSLQAPLPLTFFAKHGLVNMDLYDDWAALLVAESQKKLQNHYAGTVVDRYGLLVQSWIDSRTELPRKPDKKIFDSNNRLMATVHIDNVAYYDMPGSTGETISFHSNHLDHSKWAIAFAMDTLNNNVDDLNDLESSFVPSVFIADLNRTYTQARLKDGKQGRGGGAVATDSINLWRALFKLNPRTGKQGRFANSRKDQARKIQKRLRKHVKHFDSLSSLPLDPLRPGFFKSLRLSKKESKQPALKSIDFVPFLNELKEFVKQSENCSEHVAFMAFRSMFKSFTNGNIKGQAAKAWKAVRKRYDDEEDADYSCLLNWPEIITLPSVHIHRQIPRDAEYDDEDLRRIELENCAPHILKDSQGNLVRGDQCDSFIASLRKIPRHKETQTVPVLKADGSTMTEIIDHADIDIVDTSTSTNPMTIDDSAGNAIGIKTNSVSTSNMALDGSDSDDPHDALYTDERVLKLIESMEKSRLQSSSSSDVDSDEEEFTRNRNLYPAQIYVDEDYSRHNRNESDSDYSNREVDYDDFEDDTVEGAFDSDSDNDNRNIDEEDVDSDEDGDDSFEDHETEFYDHFIRRSRERNGEDVDDD